MQTHLSATFIYIISLAIKLPQSPHYGSPHFSKVPAFSQVGEAQGRLLSASVKSQLPLAESNPYAKVTYFKVYILIRHSPSQHFYFSQLCTIHVFKIR